MEVEKMRRGKERGGEITRNNYMNSELLNGIRSNY